ncbi:MAG: addiction module antitoxin RelB [Deltaproteobacteria bacterium CG23_combo_of_CG06-09_8_20_14_all_60_8]|nr:MAG: hypothetical protein AUK28_10250 [Desulfobacterales bacterium CG2_30_60_27]PIP44434.1 MAG: addiction module antitoxin RelB [Deltaproteobacteria bacterium CG23_combo_of_CG06-09_8_20_14_all_60_8]
MAIAFEVLEAEALKLAAAERTRLVEQLLVSLDEDSEIENAWAVEIEKRIEAADNGTVQLLPVADVLAQARAALK